MGCGLFSSGWGRNVLLVGGGGTFSVLGSMMCEVRVSVCALYCVIVGDVKKRLATG